MKNNLRSRETYQYLLLFLPSFLVFIFAVGYPFVSGIFVSLTSWDGISQNMDFAGLKNYRNLFGSTEIWKPLKNSICFAILLTIFSNILSLLAAMALNCEIRGRKIMRMAFFFPTCLSVVLATFIWKFIFRDVFSQLFGVNSILGSYDWAIVGIVIISLWNGLGINIIIYLAGLVNIPADLYEAVTVDGANIWQKFRCITLPMLMPSISVCVTMTLIGGLKEFATTMTSTGGGPAGASEMISIYIYKNLYDYYKAGYGQAVAIVFVAFLVICGGLISRILRKREVEV